MFKQDCKFGGTLDELLTMPPAWLRLVGSDGEDDDDTGSDDKSEDDGKDGDKGADGDKSKDDEESSEVKDLKRRIANFDEERDRWATKLSNEKNRADAAEAKLAKLQKDGTSDEELKKKLEEYEGDNVSLVETNKKLALEVAFLKDNTYKWKNPAAALRLADLDDVEVDDKGKVVGLKSALDKLSISDPYLLVEESEDDDKDKKPAPKGKTGDKPGNPRKDNDSASQQARRDKLMNKYTGLRR